MKDLRHTASVDENGDITLPGMPGHATVRTFVEIEAEVTPMEEGVWYSPEETEDEPVETFEIDEEIAPVSAADDNADRMNAVWSNVRDELKRVTNEAVTESVKQYKEIFTDAERVGSDSARVTGNAFKRTWEFLMQPVWVPNKRKEPVQYGRGRLFLTDTLRFGGTFASLFGLLFITLNYQSFWTIAQSYVNPLAEATGISSFDDLDRDTAEKLKRVPALATAGRNAEGLIAHLPLVGPPDDRIVIPALDLNVPIVSPSTEPLLREDWKALEEEIQESLQDGVVHYPGTARPGQAGNFFVTGHSSYFPWAPGNYKSVFARLHELKAGDEYWVFHGGDRHRYVVTGKKEIKPSDVSVLEQPTDKRIGTLMTCTPVGTTLRRLVVVSEEVDPITGVALEVGERGNETLPQVKPEMLSI